MTDQPNPYASPTDAGPDPAPPAAPAAPSAGGAPMYADPGYPQAPSGSAGYAPPRNGFGTAALVLGIVGLILFWTIILGVILGVLAIVFGVLGRKRASRREATNGGTALAGAILGGVAVAGSIALIAAGAAFFEHNKTAFHNYQQCVDQASNAQQRQQCADEFRSSIR